MTVRGGGNAISFTPLIASPIAEDHIENSDTFFLLALLAYELHVNHSPVLVG